MKQCLRRAALPLCLLATWLLLEGTVTPGQIVLGAALSFALMRAAAPLRVRHGFPRRPRSMLRLLRTVALDVVKSNLIVARFAWAGPRVRPLPGFVRIPLVLRDPNALAVLACIITYTPGTVWVRLSDDYVLTLHVLDLRDEASWVRTIRQRYEQPLREIFEWPT